MVYFTADMHFGHRAIINMQNRPFESVEEMDRVLLQNFNSVVHKNDTVYILGDICHHMKVEDADDLIRKMNGKKYLIIGNHDKKYDPRLFEDIQDFMKVSVDGRMEYNEANRAEGIRRYDVGVDVNNFFPVSVKQIIDFFGEQVNVNDHNII